jgi:NAD(P)-dependent dehydrogenase (short-subunit alcohol dehydrogenase family)
MDSLLDFTDKNILITGAGSGFGAALSCALAARGATLILADINAAGLDETVAKVKAFGTEVAMLVGNVADELHAKALVDLAQNQFGRLDFAVNNAGVAPNMAPIHQTLSEVLDLQLNVNVKGVAFGMKYQLPAITKAGGGAILNVSSMAGIGGAPMASSYAAAKHAVIGLTKTGACEFGGKNVRVNAICPFFSQTPMVLESDAIKSGTVEEANSKLAQGCPMKRIAELDEIVNVMVMMLSPQNTYMNGVAIAVDGGMSAM